jgi:hypothetical protein
MSSGEDLRGCDKANGDANKKITELTEWGEWSVWEFVRESAGADSVSGLNKMCGTDNHARILAQNLPGAVALESLNLLFSLKFLGRKAAASLGRDVLGNVLI